MKHTLAVYTFQYTKGKLLNLKSFAIQACASKELALAILHNSYGISYVRDSKMGCIGSTFQFGWVPKYITFAAIEKLKGGDFHLGFDLRNQMTKNKITRLLDELIIVKQENNFFGGDKAFKDMSIQMSDWHWQLTIPKGYEVLQPGEIILETDQEYSDTCSCNKYWSDVVSWYNVGKQVEEGYGMTMVHADNSKTHHPGHPRPLICRKKA